MNRRENLIALLRVIDEKSVATHEGKELPFGIYVHEAANRLEADAARMNTLEQRLASCRTAIQGLIQVVDGEWPEKGTEWRAIEQARKVI